MIKKIIIIYFFLFLTSFNVFSFYAPWMLEDNFNYIIPLSDTSLKEVVISDISGKKLEVLTKTEYGFTRSGKVKFNISNDDLGIKITYSPLDLKSSIYFINILDSFNYSLYVLKRNMKYTNILGSLINDSYERKLLDKNLDLIRVSSKVISTDLNVEYYFDNLKRIKFHSEKNYFNSFSYEEIPYYGLEYAAYEVIEDFYKYGEVKFDKPTYKPYVKNIHTEEEVDGVLIVTDEIYDIGGVCFRRSTHFRDGKIIKKVFNKYPENLNPENPDRKKYYDDEVEPYLYDIYLSKIDFDKNNIIINYYYEDDDS